MDFKEAITKYDKICNEEFDNLIKYIYLDNDGIYLYNDKNIKIKPSMVMIMSDCWKEYKEGYKTNFEFKYDDRYTLVTSDGTLSSVRYDCGGFDKEVTENFNIFNNSQYAMYIHKKNLLQRKMETFAYLNNEREKELKYYVASYLDEDGTFGISSEEDLDKGKTIYHVTQFTSEELADKCIELYGDEIKEVLELKKEIYNK